MRMALRLFRTAIVLLQARYPCVQTSLTVLVDAHVLLLGKDGVVGVDAILLEHSFVAVECQWSF